jgi:SAM-dependent methyltransferase
VHVGSIEHLPPPLAEAQFDLITAFDVLEHITDDLAALELLRKRLISGGKLALTVPAYQWLWSQHDVVNEHRRRYTKGQLVTKLDRAGWRTLRATYFNTLLFPPIAAVRILQRVPGLSHFLPSDLNNKPSPIDRLLLSVFASEAGWLVHGDFPFGVSIIIIAEPIDFSAT